MVRSRRDTVQAAGELMYWQESDKKEGVSVPSDVVDLVYRIECRSLPVDHAHSLSEAIVSKLSWFEKEELAGLHPVHIPDSGNGWMRSEDPDELMHLSRRTRLILRLPRHRVQDAQALSGQTLVVKGYEIKVGDATEKSLVSVTTLFSRYIVSPESSTEEDFLAQSARHLQDRGIRVRKMMCGKAHSIGTPEGRLHARSLMLAELSLEDSFSLQRSGIGELQHLGCGVFIPHKDIAEVSTADNGAV